MNYNAALAHFSKITYSRYKRLIGYFSNTSHLWSAELTDLIRAGLEENIANEFLVWRDQTSVEKIMERLEKENIYTISLGETRYPRLLAEITDPPHTIFVRGQLPPDHLASIGIVGTRQHSQYGQDVCEKITKELSRLGIVIVSGLALGIDGIAHASALRTKGKTIAVLGSSIDRQHVYPSAHKYLADQIIESDGAILSEYPPGFLPTRYSFPARNRIIAGLTLGTLVIEAPESSGALITTKCALDYNREVMTIPHPISSQLGAGCNNLIKMGAKLVSSVDDILETLNLQPIIQKSSVQTTLNLNTR